MNGCHFQFAVDVAKSFWNNGNVGLSIVVWIVFCLMEISTPHQCRGGIKSEITAFSCSCVLANSETCFKWLSRIKQEINAAASFNDIFAAWFHAAVGMQSLVSDWEMGRCSQYSLDSEMRRLGFRKDWKITNVNENYRSVSGDDQCYYVCVSRC